MMFHFMCMHHILCIHSPVSGHVGCFSFSVIMNNASVDIRVYTQHTHTRARMRTYVRHLFLANRAPTTKKYKKQKVRDT